MHIHMDFIGMVSSLANREGLLFNYEELIFLVIISQFLSLQYLIALFGQEKRWLVGYCSPTCQTTLYYR
jgi:hypothetical protein